MGLNERSSAVQVSDVCVCPTRRWWQWFNLHCNTPFVVTCTITTITITTPAPPSPPSPPPPPSLPPPGTIHHYHTCTRTPRVRTHARYTGHAIASPHFIVFSRRLALQVHCYMHTHKQIQAHTPHTRARQHTSDNTQVVTTQRHTHTLLLCDHNHKT